MIVRTMPEWSGLGFGPGHHEIPEPAAARIAAAARSSGLAGGRGDGVLDFGRTALRSKSIVGVIAAGDAVLEILPKIDVGAEGAGGVRRRLVHMLSVALEMDVDVGAMSAQDWQRDTLLEILIRLFAQKLADGLRRGMPRGYVGCEDDLPHLRGRLDAQRQFTRHAADATLACRYDAFSMDIALNRVMKAAVVALLRLARSVGTRRLLNELALAYADVGLPARDLGIDRIRLDRTNARWRELLRLAELLLGRRYQTTSVGETSGYALLFDMNSLFEQYVARLLRQALAGGDVTVHPQGGRRFCLLGDDGAGLFQTRPDILLRRRDAVVAVIDTKWKRLGARVDDPKRGISQTDVYQMMAYARLYDCTATHLLYPHNGALPAEAGILSDHRIAGSGGQRLFVRTIDVAAAVPVARAALRTAFAASARDVAPAPG